MNAQQESTPRIQLDAVTLIGIACLFVAWFLLNIFVTRLGNIELRFRF